MAKRRDAIAAAVIAAAGQESMKFSPMDRRAETKSRGHRRPLLGTGVAVLLAAVVTLYARYALTRPVIVREPGVAIAPVRWELFTEYVPAAAVVVPRTTAYLDAVEGGQVGEVLVEEGALVTRGQVLVKLKNTNLELEILARQAQLMEQLDRLNQTILSFEQARITHKRDLIEASAGIESLTQRLQRREALRANGGTVSQEEIAELAINVDTARKLQAAALEARELDEKFRHEQLEQVRSSIATTRENLEMASRTLQSLSIKAPISGQLTALDADLGAAKTRGQRIGQIDDSTAYKIEARVDELYLGRVKIGLPATAESNGTTWKLQVAKVYPQVTDRQFKVDLYFQAATPEDLRRGQSMQVRLEVDAPSKRLVASNGPFFEETGGNWVFVLPPSGDVAQRRQVRFGRRNPEQIEVLSGLAEGERIISSDYQRLRKFERIEIKSEKN